MNLMKWPLRRGFSLIEFCAVSTIVGILAAIVVPRVVIDESLGKEKIRDHYSAAIDVAVKRYHAEHGAWPTAMADLADDPEFFPDGLPLNPVTGQPFVLNEETRQAQ
ncbi:type IV pilin protein [Lacipirellula sp.]|uniref:type IV pilin protein n=1 Tax=Lacipirellula sp. TaxID=2691419 RepID=UPI003D0A617B